MALDPTTVANKWAQRLGMASEDIKRGVQGVTVAPGIAAAKQADVWLNNITASKPKWIRRVSSVSLSDWQDAMINKGLPRVAQGANEAIPKMTDFLTQFLPHVEQVSARVAAMPKGTLEAGIARMVEQVRGNAAFVRK